MRLTLPLLILASFPLHAAGLEWRGVWEWSLPKKTEADLTRLADSAHALGFNALMMFPPQAQMAFMRDQCHQRGLRLYLSTVFAGGKPEWRQVMLPEETERAKSQVPVDYMSGGEPVHPDEVFNSPLPCYARPEVIDYFRQMVVRNAQQPVDGLAFDYTGFQNYRRCYCSVCRGKVDPEQTILNFINTMAATARQARPDISLTIHVYPWFAPDPYYGHKTDIDYVGQTVSWFFRPHWPLAKVQRLTEQLVRDQHRVYPTHLAAPFLGFDARKHRDYRSAKRLRQELQIIEQSGAQALQVAELGYLLDKPLIAQAVAEELGGSYRAD